MPRPLQHGAHPVTLRLDTPGEARVIARVLDLRSGEQLELTELVEVC